MLKSCSAELVQNAAKQTQCSIQCHIARRMDNERTHIFNYLCLKKHTQINTKNIYLVLLLYIEIDDLFISLLKLLLN